MRHGVYTGVVAHLRSSRSKYLENRKSYFWKYFTIFILTQVSIVVGVLLFMLFGFFFFGIDPNTIDQLRNENELFDQTYILTHVATSIIIFYFTYKKIHNADFVALTFRSSIRLKNVIKFGLVFTTLNFLVELIATFSFGGHFELTKIIVPNLTITGFGILVVVISSAFEEFVFRGYLLRSLFEYSNKKILSSLVISILFSISHWSSLNNLDFPLIGFLDFFIWSYFVSLIALKYQSMEAAIGIHIFWNLSEDLLLGNAGSSSLFQRPFGNLYSIFTMVISFIIYLRYLHWNNKRITTSHNIS